MKNSTRLILAGCTVALAFAGCEKKQATAPTTPQAPQFMLASLPAEAVSVAQAKQSAKQGDSITLRGRIGGRKDALSTDIAVFTLTDASLPSCDQLHGDRCATPWDYCCETPESLLANTATVQVVDQSGKVMKIDLGNSDVHPLDEVVVVGTVDARPSPEVLVIKATGVYLAKHMHD